jgi:transcriptional regulator with XRE-family HTH domain
MPRTKSTKGNTDVDIHIGARLRLRRMQLEMSQTDLANGTGITFQQIQKYEKGRNRIGGSRMVQFAKMLKVPPGWFFEGLDGIPSKTPDDAMMPAELVDGGDALSILRGLAEIDNPQLRRKIARLVEAIAER